MKAYRWLSVAIISLTLIFIVAITVINKSKVSVNLRKFPYPYRAALTICSDIDSIETVEEFLSIHEFLNTERVTRFGKGLNLEIGDTFWMYSNNIRSNQFTYFEGLTDRRSSSAKVIEQFAKAGYLDALHTFGDFSNYGGFKRELAEKAIKELKKREIKVHIWVNHGDIYNTQSMNNGKSNHKGANTSATEYHADITIPYGMKFLWVTELTRIVGQDRKVELSDLVHYDWKSPIKTDKEIIKAYVGEITISTINSGNKLLRIYELDDGQLVYIFKRFNNYQGNIWKGASLKYLKNQISKDVLEKLKNKEGYMIVYNHLTEDDLLDKDTISALRYLANENKKGEIYISTTYKLLNYNLIHNNLVYTTIDDGKDVTILINNINDKVFGQFKPTIRDLQGLTFYVPDDVKVKVVSRDFGPINVKNTLPILQEKLVYPSHWCPSTILSDYGCSFF